MARVVTRIPALGLALAAMLAATGPAPASAGPAGAESGRGRPVLADHDFTETVAVPSPLVRTYLRNRLGGGQYTNEDFLPIIIGDQEIVALPGSLLFLSLDFEYQYAIKPWLATRFRVLGAGRLGSDTLALLSDGVTMATGYEFGWLVRLREAERTAFALDLNLSDRGFTGVNIVSFVEDLIAGDPATLVRKVPALRGSAGLRFAWAASPLLGISARTSTGYGEAVDRRQQDAWFWNLALAVDCDLRRSVRAPLGVAVGYSYDSLPEFTSDLAEGIRTIFVRLSYLGRDDFLFSLDLARSVVPLEERRSDLKGLSAMISLRYYI